VTWIEKVLLKAVKEKKVVLLQKIQTLLIQMNLKRFWNQKNLKTLLKI
jgi:hypothetical protein